MEGRGGLPDQRRSLEGCDALVWDKPTIRAWALRYLALVQNMLRTAVMEHITWLVSMHISLAEDDGRGRVDHLLMSVACAIGKPAAGGSIEVEITNEDLAAGVLKKDRSKVAAKAGTAGPLKSPT
jgi:hypothetical protein